MTNESPLNSVPSSSNSSSVSPIGPGESGAGSLGAPAQEGGPGSFSLGQKGQSSTGSSPSPIDVATQGAGSTGPLQQPTIPNLINQSNTLQQSMGNIHDQISKKLSEFDDNLRPRAQFTTTHASLMHNYLQQISDKASFIGDKLNAPLTPSNLPATPEKGVAHFLNYIAGSQTRLKQIANSLSDLKNPTPGDLFAVQVKMNGIQQQVEFFTTILGKALSDISTIMQLQN